MLSSSDFLKISKRLGMKAKIERPYREQHYDEHGRARMSFSGHWRAQQYRDKKG